MVKPDGVLLKGVNRYKQIYRQASLKLMTVQKELVQLGALNTTLKACSLLFETTCASRVYGQVKGFGRQQLNIPDKKKINKNQAIRDGQKLTEIAEKWPR